ncbi:MAG: TolC family protein [Archangiaceae bacterium]|nr:TolC family protein [Archangiaceae bacterium]
MQFTGWPSVAVGTFGGVVALVDSHDDGGGRFRLVVKPDPAEPHPWPSAHYLRQGTRVNAWVLLDQVKLGFELWRQFSGFPPSLKAAPDAAAGGKERAGAGAGGGRRAARARRGGRVGHAASPHGAVGAGRARGRRGRGAGLSRRVRPDAQGAGLRHPLRRLPQRPPRRVGRGADPAVGGRAERRLPAGAGSFPLYYGERETDDWGELRAGLTVPLLRNGPTDRRRANVERAALGTRVAQLNAQAQRLELRRQGAVRWLRWVAAGERLALARQLLELAQARQVQLETRARSGDLPAIDALDNRRAITQREGVVVSARRSLEEAANELSLFVRDERGAPVQVDPARLPRSLSAPSPAPAAVSLDEALSRRPDLARLEAQRGQAAVEVGLARNQLLPALDLGAFVSKDLGPSSDAKRSVAELELMVSLEVPLLYRQLFGRLDGAAASERRAALQVQLQQERVRVEIADGLSASRAAAERAALMTRELELARALEDGERRRFELGDSNLFLVNLRETQTFEAALREVDARADWHRASADLTAALAAP